MILVSPLGENQLDLGEVGPRRRRRDMAPIRHFQVTPRSGPVRPTQRQPMPPASGDKGRRPMQPDEVAPIRQPMLRAGPWRAESKWSCLVQGCDRGGPDKSYVGLKCHFARCHLPQRVEFVCPYGETTPAPKENLKLGTITQTAKWTVGM